MAFGKSTPASLSLNFCTCHVEKIASPPGCLAGKAPPIFLSVASGYSCSWSRWVYSAALGDPRAQESNLLPHVILAGSGLTCHDSSSFPRVSGTQVLLWPACHCPVLYFLCVAFTGGVCN